MAAEADRLTRVAGMGKFRRNSGSPNFMLLRITAAWERPVFFAPRLISPCKSLGSASGMDFVLVT